MSRSDQALLYDPHLSTLGGAERYVWSLAKVMRASGLEVTVAGPAVPTAQERERLGFAADVQVVQLAPPLFTPASAGLAFSVWVDNAVPRPSLARRRLAVLSFPFQDLTQIRGGLWRRAAVRGVQDVVVYSAFAQEWAKVRWGVGAHVIPPAVELRRYEPEHKEQLILAVGRFFPHAHSKRQDVLIEAFRRFAARPEGAGWRLVLAGGLERRRPDHLAWYDELVRQADGLDVQFMTSVDGAELARLYARASLFWHATGFGRPATAPERAEHFGITTVEAMSAGAVPLVYGDGGQVEIVDESVGRLWWSVEDLVAATVAATQTDLAATARRAVDRSAAWDDAAFARRVRALLGL